MDNASHRAYQHVGESDDRGDPRNSLAAPRRNSVAAEDDSCLGTPLLRKDWERLEGADRLGGRVTAEEALWVVIVTMGIAEARDNIMETMDLEWLVLHFFCLWGVVASSITYSARFNNADLFHGLLWALFLFGLAAQISFLDDSLVGFAGATGFLYILMAAAFARVAVLSRRSRTFSLFWMGSNLCVASLFVLLALFPERLGHLERGLLWINVVWEAVSNWVFYFVSEFFQGSWDLPLSIRYIIKRYEGFHMMTMVCTFLFPIALQGAVFQASWDAAAQVILANIYALALKMSLQDASPDIVDEAGLRRHAIRRSRPTAIFFLLIHPISMLGIFISGVGFVAAIVGKPLEFARSLICLGTALTWVTTAVTKSLHMPVDAHVHHVKVALIAACSLLFLLPLAFRLSQLATSVVVAASSVLLLVGLVASELCLGDAEHDDFMHNWKVHPPRPLKTWDTYRDLIGARVTGLEHFFTVLFAVAIFQLNEELIEGEHVLETIELYLLKFLILYATLAHTMRYAARFNDDDLWHKFLWSAYQFCLLLLLEGAGSNADAPLSMYKILATCTFALLALLFNGRVFVQLKPHTLRDGTVCNGRFVAAFFGATALLQALLMATTCLSSGFAKPLLWTLVVVSFASETVFTFVALTGVSGRSHKSVTLPQNIEYIVERYNGLLMEVLGVAIVVPNAVYPGDYNLRWRAAACTGCACVLVLCLKSGFLDVDPTDLAHHAVRRGKWTSNIFFALHPLCLLGMGLMGGALKLLLESAASDVEGPNTFAQQLMCAASALTMGSATLTKLTHTPQRARVHFSKAGIGAACTLAHLCVWMQPTSDLTTMVSIVGLHVVATYTQLGIGAVWPA